MFILLFTQENVKRHKSEVFDRNFFECQLALHFWYMSDNSAEEQKQVEETKPEEQKQEEDKTKQTVYVGSLSWNTTEDGLREAFEKYGKVTAVRIPRDDRDRSKGFGFVEFENADEAAKACELDGTDLDGRNIKVNISQPRAPRSHDRGYNDRRGGDRYGDRRGDRRGGDRYGDRRRY